MFIPLANQEEGSGEEGCLDDPENEPSEQCAIEAKEVVRRTPKYSLLVNTDLVANPEVRVSK